ncbi:MAG: TlpA family protein disulfide reductase [Candidatus Didemnitutus sp.]|jgi:thiol-disulfide isomerase/thioredoxin|nr:TlpA family protein disulfide reductase [Candidatus Didemnitutus sp.]
MKSFLTAFLCLSFLSATAFAAAPAGPAASGSEADQAWAKLEKTLQSGPGPGGSTPEDRFVAIFVNITDYLRLAQDFFTQHASDPRRWRAFLTAKDFYGATLNMLEQQDAATRQRVDAILSAAEREAWSARIAGWERAFNTAVDVPADVRYQAEIAGWFEQSFALMNQKLAEDASAWSGIRRELDRLALKFSDLPETGDLVKHYTRIRFAEGKDTTVRRAELQSLAALDNRHVSAAAREQLQFLDLAKSPLELAFTAADGREVDLKKLRGKVVLIDFWATWCMPCIEEIPTIKKVYAQYHDQGFEVVGITLENPSLGPKDTEEQKAKKLAAAREKMLAFTRKHEMPWPQHFDGKWWKNDIARRYAIDAIPAMFLLDREGLLVSTNARGEKLEAEVKRLLGL